MRQRATMTVLCVLFVGVSMHTMAAVAQAQRAPWRIATTPTVRIGTSDKPDELLAAPAGATRLPSGNILVGDQGDFALREFAPSGALVKRYARKGKGPGEVTFLAPLLRCGDSLLANDITGPASIFTLDGAFVRAFRFKTTPYRFACNRTGQVVNVGWDSDKNMKPEVNRSLTAYWIARTDSSAPVPLGDMPGSERIGHRPYPLGREPRVAIGATRAYVALADSFVVRVFDLTGKALPSLSAPVPRVAATPADLVAEREREIAMMGERARKSTELEYQKIPLPKFLPATRDLIVDSDGNLWVQHYPRAALPTVSWTVFSPAGTVLSTVALPTVMEVYEIGRDYVLGRYIDPDESVPEVRLYPLSRR
jgi:hypothetical protein